MFWARPLPARLPGSAGRAAGYRPKIAPHNSGSDPAAVDWGPGQSCPNLNLNRPWAGDWPGGSRPSDASAGAPGPWRSRCHRFRLPLTVGSESICVLGPHTHTHGAGRHGEVHPWGAVGVPSATARPCSVRVAAGRLHAGAGPGAVCRLPCGRRSGASSSCRAPARPRRHALSRTEQGFLRGLCRAPIRAYALGRRRSRRAYGREPRAASR